MLRIIGLLLLLAAAPAPAESIQPLESIRAEVARYLQDRLSRQPGQFRVEVGRVDPRLRLPACSRPLDPFLPPGRRHLAGNLTVGVRCAGHRPWKLFVGANVAVFRQVVVLSRPARRGEAVTAAHLRLEERNTSRLAASYFVETAPLLGTTFTRSLRTGAVLSEHHVAAAKVIRRGQRVVLLARGSGLEVRMAGKALADGAVGDLVRARNVRSRRTVEGKVVGAGVVEVRM